MIYSLVATLCLMTLGADGKPAVECYSKVLAQDLKIEQPVCAALAKDFSDVLAALPGNDGAWAAEVICAKGA